MKYVPEKCTKNLKSERQDGLFFVPGNWWQFWFKIARIHFGKKIVLSIIWLRMYVLVPTIQLLSGYGRRRRFLDEKYGYYIHILLKIVYMHSLYYLYL